MANSRNKRFWYPDLDQLSESKWITGRAIPLTEYVTAGRRGIIPPKPVGLPYQQNPSTCRTISFKLPIDGDGQKVLVNWSYIYLRAYNLARQYDIENPTEWTNGTHTWKNKVSKWLPDKFLASAANVLNDKHSIMLSICEYHKNKKSALSNRRAGNIRTFNLRPKPLNTQIVHMEFEKTSCNSKNLVGKYTLHMKAHINQQFVIRFNRENRTAKLLIRVPINTYNVDDRPYAPVSVDLGLRTFAACYDFHTYRCIGDENAKLDKLINLANNKVIPNAKKSRRYKRKRFRKIKNKIKDLHYKTARYLCDNYTEVYIGDFKSQSCIVASTNKTVKQRLNQYSFYKFKDTLDYIALKYNTKVYRWNEYLTSKTCSYCKHVKSNLGDNEIYKCLQCKKKTYRDCNAARNGMINTLSLG